MRALVSLLACLLIVFVAYPGITNFLFTGSSAQVKRSRDGFLAVSHGSNYFELNIGASVNLSEYVVVESRRPQGSVRDLGVVQEVAVVAREKYAEFKSLTAAGSCPASFLNDNATTLLLVPDEDKSALLLASMKLKEGDALLFRARELEVAYAEVKGVVLDSFEVNNAALLLVEPAS